MKQVVTKGIVLTRTNFGEADRVVTMLTPDTGKVRLMAKAVRRPLSKLAGGIELFSISNITYLPGKGGLATLVSSRLITHYSKIVSDINRTLFGYELLKILNRTTEDVVGQEYFDLLSEMLVALNQLPISIELIELVFSMQLIEFSGHSPNLQTDTRDKVLSQNQTYSFDYDRMAFRANERGKFSADHIKLLRLSQAGQKPERLQKITKLAHLLPEDLQLARTIRHQYLRA